MLSKSFLPFIFLVASISSVNAHAGVTPALGVKGQMTRNDVQRPSTNSPCGNVNIAQNIDSSTTVQADEKGNFSPTITDFNGGADGSRSIQTVQVDASGTGKKFVPAKMVANGNPNPATTGTENITAQLPPGTKCNGGAKQNLCLASFTTTAGFGNCVVVSQGAAALNASVVSGASAASNASAASSASASPSTSCHSKSFPSGAAKGVKRSIDSRSGHGSGKLMDEKKRQNPGEKENKDGKTGKKKGDKKKGKGPVKSGKAKTPPAADGKNNKRSWSSRQMDKL